MKFRTIVRYGVIAASVMLGASSVDVSAQETGRDAIYSRFEEYDADTSQDKIRELLDAFGQHLKSNPSLRAFLISYGGKQSCRNEALLRPPPNPIPIKDARNLIKSLYYSQWRIPRRLACGIVGGLAWCYTTFANKNKQ